MEVLTRCDIPDAELTGTIVIGIITYTDENLTVRREPQRAEEIDLHTFGVVRPPFGHQSNDAVKAGNGMASRTVRESVFQT